MTRRYVIVGSGAAGIATAETLRQADPAGQICLVSAEHAGYYSRPGLAYYLAGEVDIDQLYPYHSTTLRRLGDEWITEQAVRLEPAAHYLHLQDGRTLLYDRLLLAPGASAVMPDLPGIHLEGVVKLDTLEDTKRILRLARRGKPAIVAGGGITALELVEGLVARGMRVHYLLRGERYWSNVLDPVESYMVQERLKEDGVILHTNVQVSEILGHRTVEGIRTQEGQVIPARLAAFAVGIRPRLELARSGGLAVKRGIQVNDYLQTSDPDIFAAGDVAELTDPVSGEGVLESLWNPARLQGQAAGTNMAGSPTIYQRISPLNVTRLAGIVTTIIGQVGQAKPDVDRDLNGIMRGDSEIWRQGPDAVVAQTYGHGSRLRLYVGEHFLYGALIMGDQTPSRPLQHLIENKVDIRPIHAELLTPGTKLSQLLKDYEQHSLQSIMKSSR